MPGPTDATRRDRERARPVLLAQLRAAKTLPCPRCGKPMRLGMKLDVGHQTDVVDGGLNSPLRLEHASCNRRAGDRRRGRGKRSTSKRSNSKKINSQKIDNRMQTIIERDNRRRLRFISPSKREPEDEP